MICGRALAARIERAEAGLVAVGADAARLREPTGGVLVLPLAGGVAAWAGADSPLNKVAGLGFTGALDEVELAAVEIACAERGAPVRVELSTLAEESIAPALSRRGYVLTGHENVLALALDRDLRVAASAEIEVSESAPDEFHLWLDVVVSGFAQPDADGAPAHEEFPREVLERVIGDLAGGAGLRRYLARRSGITAGGASLRLADGVAQLCGAATLPEHRRRGVQSTLLAVRLAAAAAAGCDLAVVTTQPGSKSQANVQRQGFALLYSRAILVREP